MNTLYPPGTAADDEQDDVDTQWAIAARADSLSLSGTDLDDRACYTLYLDGCRALFK